MIKTLAIISLFLYAMPGWALDDKVFGFEIGKPLGIPECKRHPLDPNIYAEYQQITCEALDRNPDRGYTHNIVRFSTGDQPRMVKGNLFYAIESQGVLIGAQFDTYGVQYQDAVFADLKAKYGKPSIVRRTAAQNAFGASFGILHVVWRLAGLTVTFNGAKDESDEGNVTVDTPEAAKVRSGWEAHSNTGKTL